MKSFIVRAAAMAVGLAVAVPATAADVALVIANYNYDGRSPIRDRINRTGSLRACCQPGAGRWLERLVTRRACRYTASVNGTSVE